MKGLAKKIWARKFFEFWPLMLDKNILVKYFPKKIVAFLEKF